MGVRFAQHAGAASLAVVVAIVAACHETTGAPTAEPVTDAAAGASLPAEGGADADTPSEAGEPTEAAGGVGYCSSTGPHYFCDDFDEDPLAHDWDQVTQQHGLLTLDAARATSHPYALLATAPALAEGALAIVALAKQIVDTPPQLHVAFDFAADVLDSSGAPATVLVVDLLATDGTIAEVLSLQVTSSGGTLVDTAGESFVAQHPFAWSAISTGNWSRVELDVHYAADGGTGSGVASLTVDGETALGPVAMSPTSQPSLPSLQLGLVSLAGPSGAVAVRFDDFTFATVP